MEPKLGEDRVTAIQVPLVANRIDRIGRVHQEFVPVRLNPLLLEIKQLLTLHMHSIDRLARQKRHDAQGLLARRIAQHEANNAFRTGCKVEGTSGI